MALDPLGRTLLGVARQAIAEALAIDFRAALTWSPELDAPASTFVTLTCDGALRGCIGSLAVRRPLRDDVVHNALAAAFEDYRFARLTPAEYPRLAIEVSLLSAMEPVAATSRDEACRALRPGIDGVLLECGAARATFLPQVWEHVGDPHRFLLELERKAGLPREHWTRETRLSRYTVTKWREADLVAAATRAPETLQ